MRRTAHVKAGSLTDKHYCKSYIAVDIVITFGFLLFLMNFAQFTNRLSSYLNFSLAGKSFWHIEIQLFIEQVIALLIPSVLLVVLLNTLSKQWLVARTLIISLLPVIGSIKILFVNSGAELSALTPNQLRELMHLIAFILLPLGCAWLLKKSRN